MEPGEGSTCPSHPTFLSHSFCDSKAVSTWVIAYKGFFFLHFPEEVPRTPHHGDTFGALMTPPTNELPLLFLRTLDLPQRIAMFLLQIQVYIFTKSKHEFNKMIISQIPHNWFQILTFTHCCNMMSYEAQWPNQETLAAV